MHPYDTLYKSAAAYRKRRPSQSPSQLRESQGSFEGFSHTERHLQCVWYDPLYRPGALITCGGEQITVLDPGRWNLEAGPDFLDATLVVGPERRQLQGDVEIHIRPEDWQHHGHSRDARYEAVALHVTYWPPGSTKIDLPPGALQLSLKEALDQAPAFHFESIDTSAYPYAIPPRLESTEEPLLAGVEPDTHIQLLESAGEERLRQKTERMALGIRQWGLQQSLYEWIMGALGYKANRVAFRQLARKVTYAELTNCDSPDDALGILMGVAGLIPGAFEEKWDHETRQFIRRLWDSWWKQQSRWEPHILEGDTWSLAGIRPVNHPIRRMAAATSLFTRSPDLGRELLTFDLSTPDRWLQQADGLLNVESAFPYWTQRQGLSGESRKTPVALIGKERRNTIVANVLVPFVAAQDVDITALLPALPAEASNQWIRDTANTLFGPDHNPTLYAQGLRQQGLIQIFHDFCLSSRQDALRQLLLDTTTSSLR
jgi:hypothetical protein